MAKVGRKEIGATKLKANKKDYDAKHFQKVGKYNQRIRRLEEKQLKDYLEQVEQAKLGKQCPTLSYRQSITDYYTENGNFNAFFTGTYNPNFKPNHVKDMNKQLAEHNNNLPTEALNYQYTEYRGYMSFERFKSYSYRFVEQLRALGYIDCALTFFEPTHQEQWHNHILIEIIDPSITMEDIQRNWIFGLNSISEIEDKWMLQSKIWYSTKELKYNPKNSIEDICSLYWMPFGDFTKVEEVQIIEGNVYDSEAIETPLILNKVKELNNKIMKTVNKGFTPEQSEQLKQYKKKNNLDKVFTKDYWLNQARINQEWEARHIRIRPANDGLQAILDQGNR